MQQFTAARGGAGAAAAAARRRQPLAVRAGVLDFLKAPSRAAPTGGAARANELAARLLDAAAPTRGGWSASPAARGEIEALVDELEAFCPRAPLESEAILGTWEVVYSSKPQSKGGPFASPLGRALLPGQRALQTISAPNVCVNELRFKTLGVLPGAVKQRGEIEPIDGRTFTLTFDDLNGKVGGPRVRTIQIAYLDNNVRVARALPTEDGAEGSFFVLKKVAGPGEAAADDDEGDEGGEAPAPSGSLFGKFALPSLPSAGGRGGGGTQAQQQQRRSGTQAGTTTKRAGTQAGTTSKRSGTQAGTTTKSRADIAAERAAARAAAEAQRVAAREAAAAAKAAAEEERRAARAAAERERAELAERRAAARAQAQELAAEAAAAAAEARDAAAAVKAAEREAAGLLRAAAQARSAIDAAAAAAQAAAAELDAARGEEIEAAAEAALLRERVRALQKGGRLF